MLLDPAPAQLDACRQRRRRDAELRQPRKDDAEVIGGCTDPPASASTCWSRGRSLAAHSTSAWAGPTTLASRVGPYATERLAWDGRDWPVPAPPEAYLACVYGTDWRAQHTVAAGVAYDRCYLDTAVSSQARTPESLPRALNLGLARLSHALEGREWSKAVAYCAQLLAREELPDAHGPRPAAGGRPRRHAVRWLRRASPPCCPPAAGGTRLGLGDKGFLELAGKPLLHWVAEKARQVAGEVLVAVPGERLDEARALLPGCVVIAGGATRHASVARLVDAASGDQVLVHDVARPFASVGLMRAVLAAAGVQVRRRHAGSRGASGAPVRRPRGGGLGPQRAAIFQAPQAFDRALLLRLLREADQAGWEPQSTLQLAVRAGIPVVAVPGEKSNIKITSADDWRLAQLLESHLR